MFRVVGPGMSWVSAAHVGSVGRGRTSRWLQGPVRRCQRSSLPAALGGLRSSGHRGGVVGAAPLAMEKTTAVLGGFLPWITAESSSEIEGMKLCEMAAESPAIVVLTRPPNVANISKTGTDSSRNPSKLLYNPQYSALQQLTTEVA